MGDGNLALNTNPMPDGRIEPRQVDSFKKIGDWLTKYGESIYGTRGGPFLAPDHHGQARHRFDLPAGRWWGGSTHKDKTVYLHILRWPTARIFLPDIGSKLVSHKALTGSEAVVTQADDGIEVSMPAGKRDPLDTIIKLEFDKRVDNVKPIVTGKPSLALGCKASASGIWPNPRLGAELAFDGNPSTRWGGAPDTKAGWLAVDLGQPKTFGELRISEAYDRIRKFELQIKVDGNWKTIRKGTTAGADFSVTFEPVTARHVRLNIIEATGVPTIWEVRLFP
jgi:alpha-L-fucosidase